MPTQDPLYLQILHDLTNRLRLGEFPVGSTLPTEMRLCEEYGASRHTVREAMRRLASNGLVVRRQKTGTTVVAAQAPTEYVQTIATIADLYQYALNTTVTILSQTMTTVDAWLAARLDAEIGSPWLKLELVRREPGGAVICYTTSFIPERLAWIGPELEGCRGPFHAMLAERTEETIMDVVQEIHAEAMPDHVADGIGFDRGSIALRVLRRYVSESGTLIASFNWHPADAFTYVMRVHRTEPEHGRK